MIEDERKTPRAIPENYKGSIYLLGFAFSIRNLFEGMAIALCLGIIALIIVFILPLKFATRISTIICFAGIGLAIGVKGVNDEPIFEWFKNYKAFKSNKHIAFFNPHIKKDKKSFADEYQKKMETLPKEKLIAIYNKAKSKSDKAEKEKIQEYMKTNIYDVSRMYFIDDVGVDKPVEYMNAKERKDYLKSEKKRIKKEQRDALKYQRERRRNGEQE